MMKRVLWQCVKSPSSVSQRFLVSSRGLVGVEPVQLKCACQTQPAPTAAVHSSARLDAGKLKNTKKKLIKKVIFKKSAKAQWDVIGIRANMTVKEVADAMGKDVDHVFEALMYIPGTDDYDEPDKAIDRVDVIKQILDKSGFRWKMEGKKKQASKTPSDLLQSLEDDVHEGDPGDDPDLEKRPPVVTIMGHVDHGKTTLLDALRKSNVVEGEFGGITQHIGAFSVTMASGDVLTFLDTPGHAAFTAMRGRGAQVTDIVVLVVAADDGVMQQTVESLRHARDADVPLIIAINKIDKHGNNIAETKNTLRQCGVFLEEDGGHVPVVPISALKGTNLDQLQETIVTLAELLELRGNPKARLDGRVIEAKTDSQKGRVATVLVKKGTLKKGVCLVAGTAWGKVRNTYDDRGRVLTALTPGEAGEISGWKVLPSAGDRVIQVDSESQAREVLKAKEAQIKHQTSSQDLEVIHSKQEAHQREYAQLRQQRLDAGKRRGAIFRKIRTKEAVETDRAAELAIILKGDVDGSVEAILNVLGTYDSNLCYLNILSHGVGPATEQDVEMAASFSGKIFQFNVSATAKVLSTAASQGVEICNHNIIYKLIDDIKDMLNERVPLMEKEHILGEASVVQSFDISVGKAKVPVAGCRCTDGELLKAKNFRLLRDNETILEGPLSSMHHYKEEASVVKQGQECGLAFSDTSVRPEPADKIVCYELTPYKPQIDWQLNF